MLIIFLNRFSHFSIRMPSVVKSTIIISVFHSNYLSKWNARPMRRNKLNDLMCKTSMYGVRCACAENGRIAK